MRLFTKNVLKEVPKLEEQSEVKTENIILYIRLFHPLSKWIWYISELDIDEGLAYGYVMGFENEWGYISIKEIESIEGIERDLQFEPTKFSDLEK